MGAIIGKHNSKGKSKSEPNLNYNKKNNSRSQSITPAPDNNGASSSSSAQNSSPNMNKQSSLSSTLGTGIPKPVKNTEISECSLKKLDELFDKYAEKNETDEFVIGTEQMEAFCQDLEVSQEDVVMFAVSWLLEAKELCTFTREEFRRFHKLRVDSLSKMKNAVSKLRQDLANPAQFKDVYKFAFSLAKEQEQKTISLDMASGLLMALLHEEDNHRDNFAEFLGEQTSYKAVNLDQWMSFLEFSRTIDTDFSNYDDTGAWPVMLDEYVEWVRSKEE